MQGIITVSYMSRKKPEHEKLSVPFHVLLTPGDYYRLQGLAKRYGIDSKGAVIRMLIRNWQTEAERMGLIET